jgi:NAD(P)-dependent dehydrogenase (short-subunit alcohol dehydrogenase family)
MNSEKQKPVVLITGASRGIGAATARLFASKGYAVCINYRANLEAAEAVAADIQRLAGSCLIVQADVSLEEDVIRLFKTVTEELGAPDVLVNNAGILNQQSRLDDLSGERIESILRNNVSSCLLCCREAVRRMSSRHGGRGGAIVNVSSLAARTGSPNEYIDYAASKGAVDSLTVGLAKEVAGEGIRVNAVRPGLIYTDIHADGGEPGRVDRLAEKIPMQRGGKAEEVAEAIYWLASKEASFVTGTFIDVAGGL